MKKFQILLCSFLLLFIGVKAIANDQTTLTKNTSTTSISINDELYIKKIDKALKSNWFPQKNNEQVDVEFTITKSGTYKHLKITRASKNEMDNQAAIEAVMFTSPFSSIPKLNKEVRIKYTFPCYKEMSSNKTLSNPIIVLNK